MIIAIVGGEGTGKSTLARQLGEAMSLPVLAPLKEGLLAESGYHTLFEWDAATHELEGLVARQAEREATLENCIVDGGVIELYCLVQRWVWHRLSPARFERTRDAAVRAAARYDRVLVTPPRVVAGPAPGRFRSEPHNRQVKRLIDAFLGETATKHSSIADVATDARLAEARRSV